jgi:thioredoxin 1
MGNKSREGINRDRIPSLIKTVVFISIILVGAGLLYSSAPISGVFSINGVLDVDAALAADSLPVLVDLGADRCVPCKMMAPILEELKKEYKGKFDIVFYDVWKDPAPAEKYRIHGIPTQIFLDDTGKELYRHAGYFSKEQILKKWKELGYDFQ